MKNNRSFPRLAVVSLAAAVVCAAAALVFLRKSAAAVMVIAAAELTFIMFIRAARHSSPAYLSLTAVMTALSVVGRMVFAPLSGFKPCTAIIIITGMSLGADAGFICGALTAVVSNIYFGQGIWTIFQVVSWGIIGLLSGAAARWLKSSKTLLYTFAMLSGVVYSAVMDIFSSVWQDGGFNPIRFAAYAAGSFPYAAVYAASNVIFLMLMYRRMSFAVERVVKKYGI